MFKQTSCSETRCFSNSYQSARNRLLDELSLTDSRLIKWHIPYAHPESGPGETGLYCDCIYMCHGQVATNLLVLISATHGVEGFAGSAIQLDIMRHFCSSPGDYKDMGMLIIHALNPWGFAWLRRCDHQGIDLNRNFIDFAQALPDNPDFTKLLGSLNNPQLQTTCHIEALWKHMGEYQFTETVTRGQYKHANACFYGGTAPAWSHELLQQLIDKPDIKLAMQIAVVDIHTGLGPYGYGEIINDHIPGTEGFNKASKWYGEAAKSPVLGDACSTVKTGLLDYFWHRVIGDRGCFVTLEFGTYSIQRFWESLLDEQNYHNRTAVRKLDHPAVQKLRDYFYPVEEAWQQRVIDRGRNVVRLAIQGLSDETA
ncbi:MAG: M14 family metallopeptidase [Gammaproteobacteria bacterium]|nr:M14 family metallopeptidase [Gammaproteobacteria bacterium]